jgi:hypothetical protein
MLAFGTVFSLRALVMVLGDQFLVRTGVGTVSRLDADKARFPVGLLQSGWLGVAHFAANLTPEGIV